MPSYYLYRVLDLSFADDRHRFLPFEGASSCVEGAEV